MAAYADEHEAVSSSFLESGAAALQRYTHFEFKTRPCARHRPRIETMLLTLVPVTRAHGAGARAGRCCPARDPSSSPVSRLRLPGNLEYSCSTVYRTAGAWAVNTATLSLFFRSSWGTIIYMMLRGGSKRKCVWVSGAKAAEVGPALRKWGGLQERPKAAEVS